MISAILFINEKGELLISRFYRDNVSKAAAKEFRSIIAQKRTSCPIVNLDKCSFMFVRLDKVYVAAVTRQNANPTMVFQFIYSLVDVFRAYFGGTFDEDAIRNHFVLIYELLDETMDHGYPQVTALTVLTSFIKMGNAKTTIDPTTNASEITSQLTGAVDWRQPVKANKYRRNEVFLDVLESVNLLMSNKGVVLRADVSGQIVMKAFLNGMPECKFGMNDKLVMEKEAAKKNVRRHGTGIAIDDVTFHRCVNLSTFDRDRTISFVPPDGEFDLMKYRVTENVNLPFKVIPVITEHGRTRVSYEVKVKGNFGSKLFATNVVIRIPVPKNCAEWVYIHSNSGKKPKHNPGQSLLIWKIKKFAGDASFTLKAECKLVSSVQDKAWSRPPITMDFQVPMFASSGLHVRFLKVFERSNYETIKWVRYMTKAGQFQVRI